MEESEVSSRTLDEDDSISTPDVRQNASKKAETVVNRDGVKQTPQGVKKSYASLFLGIDKEVREPLSKRLRWVVDQLKSSWKM